MPTPDQPPTKIVLLGPRGLLGAAWSTALAAAEHVQLQVLDRALLNLANPTSFERILADIDFQVLINCAAATGVDDCEVQGDLAYLVNATAPALLAKIAVRRGARFLHFSTDFVFDGQLGRPLSEEDTPNPISIYGKTKLAGEQAVLESSPNHVVIRLSWLFGRARAAFPEWLLSKATTSEEKCVEVVGDKLAVPTSAEAAARDLLPWTKQNATGAFIQPGGLLHYANPPGLSWAAYAAEILDLAHRIGILNHPCQVRPVPLASLTGLAAPRPLQSILSVEKFTRLAGHPPAGFRECLLQHFSPAR